MNSSRLGSRWECSRLASQWECSRLGYHWECSRLASQWECSRLGYHWECSRLASQWEWNHHYPLGPNTFQETFTGATNLKRCTQWANLNWCSRRKTIWQFDQSQRLLLHCNSVHISKRAMEGANLFRSIFSTHTQLLMELSMCKKELIVNEKKRNRDHRKQSLDFSWYFDQFFDRK